MAYVKMKAHFTELSYEETFVKE